MNDVSSMPDSFIFSVYCNIFRWTFGLIGRVINGMKKYMYARNTINFWDFVDRPLWYDKHAYPITNEVYPNPKYFTMI